MCMCVCVWAGGTRDTEGVWAKLATKRLFLTLVSTSHSWSGVGMSSACLRASDSSMMRCELAQQASGEATVQSNQ